MRTETPIRIGTRGSPLALAQAHELRARLGAAHADLAPAEAVEIVPIRTTGDRVTDRPLAEIGGKGLFTEEIEAALRDGTVHMAVHSMKDVPTWLPEGLVIACLLPREDPRDGLVVGPAAKSAKRISDLAPGAVVGTSSLRRRAQLLASRPDLEIVDLRGNVQTRLRKCADGDVDATLLALAGLRRLDLAGEAVAIETDDMLPAVAQGAIGIEICEDDAATRELLAPLNDGDTALRVTAERAVLDGLQGSCQTPVGVFAELVGGDAMRLRALLAAPDGGAVFHAERRGPVADGEHMAREIAAELIAAAGPELCRALGLGTL